MGWRKQYTTTHQHEARLQLTGKRSKQQKRKQAPQRQHAFHTSSAAPTSLGRKRRPLDAIPLRRQLLPWIRLAQPPHKNKRSAPIFALVNTVTMIIVVHQQQHLTLKMGQRYFAPKESIILKRGYGLRAISSREKPTQETSKRLGAKSWNM